MVQHSLITYAYNVSANSLKPRLQNTQMFTWLANRFRSRRKARELYGAVVAQARNPAFYRAFGVADTPDGRYGLVALHLGLLLNRLGRPDIADPALARRTFETFVTDMDGNIREMGAGDPSVPRRVKRAAGGVHDRALNLRAALARPDDDALDAALVAQVYQGVENLAAPRLARYVRAATAHLGRLPATALYQGSALFPLPEATP